MCCVAAAAIDVVRSSRRIEAPRPDPGGHPAAVARDPRPSRPRCQDAANHCPARVPADHRRDGAGSDRPARRCGRGCRTPRRGSADSKEPVHRRTGELRGSLYWEISELPAELDPGEKRGGEYKGGCLPYNLSELCHSSTCMMTFRSPSSERCWRRNGQMARFNHPR